MRTAPWLRLYTWLVIAWLSLPILVMVLFGFNNTSGKFNFVWQGWTLRWYRELFDIPDLTTALLNSLSIALIVTLASAVMGTMIGYAMGRYPFRGRAVVNLVMFANVVITPAGSTFRIRWFDESVMNTLPAISTATLAG